MNQQLLDPFGTKIPDVIEHHLDDGIALTCKFNRKGSILASGCNEGKVVLWDFDTKSNAATLDGHTMSVLGLSWSRNGRKLLSWGADKDVIVFDVEKREVCFRKTLPCIAKACAIHPRDENVLLVCPIALDPRLITIQQDKTDPTHYSVASEHIFPVAASSPEHAKQNTLQQEGAQQPTATATAATTVGPAACFSRRGERIYMGTSWGTVDVYSTETKERLKSAQVVTGQACSFNTMAISRTGEWLALCCSDKSVIVVNATTLERTSKFTDQVSHTPWQHVTFSSNGNYVIGCPADTNQKTINVWDREKGSLAKIMEGPKEHVRHTQWHPIRPMLATVTNFGTIYIWTVTQSDNWSAFAPDFEEIEENVEYEEREDEFDYVEEVEADSGTTNDTDEPVDILTVDADHFASSDEEPFAPGEELCYLRSEPIQDSPSSQDRADIERQRQEEERIAALYRERLKQVQLAAGKLPHRPGQRRKLMRKKGKQKKSKKKAGDKQGKAKRSRSSQHSVTDAAEGGGSRPKASEGNANGDPRASNQDNTHADSPAPQVDAPNAQSTAPAAASMASAQMDTEADAPAAPSAPPTVTATPTVGMGDQELN